jgi:probable rRNA maturation factor
MIEVVNRQRRLPIDNERWSRFVEGALEKLGKEREGAIVAFVSDRRMRELNQEFRGLRRTTDVLSFPGEREQFERSFDGGIGDVVISVEQAARQAREHGLSFEMEVAQLILHGLLHLCGYDHETDDGEMNRLELRLRRQLGI